MIWDFRISDLVKNPVGADINPYGEFRWSPEGPVSQIHSPRLRAGSPGIFPSFLRSVQMLKREWGAESNEKLRHLFIPSKSELWFLSLQWKDQPLDRTANLGSCVCSERPAFGQNCNLGSCVCSERPALRQGTLLMMILLEIEEPKLIAYKIHY